MKKIFLLASGICLLASSASAQLPYIEEVKALGAISGQGMACGSSRYATFEMLARAIMFTKAPNLEIMNKGIYAYNEEKANAYMAKQLDGYYECPQIVRRFDNQAIFDITLYADGSLKMPNGRIIKPFRPYDAAQIYDTSAPEIGQAQEIYEDAKLNIPPEKLNSQVTSLKPEPKVQYQENQTAPKAPTALSPQRAPATTPGIKRISRDN